MLQAQAPPPPLRRPSRCRYVAVAPRPSLPHLSPLTLTTSMYQPTSNGTSRSALDSRESQLSRLDEAAAAVALPAPAAAGGTAPQLQWASLLDGAQGRGSRCDVEEEGEPARARDDMGSTIFNVLPARATGLSQLTSQGQGRKRSVTAKREACRPSVGLCGAPQ